MGGARLAATSRAARPTHSAKASASTARIDSAAGGIALSGEGRRAASSDATMTRVSSMRSMPRAASCSSSPAGCENGVMRKNGGKPASA